MCCSIGYAFANQSKAFALPACCHCTSRGMSGPTPHALSCVVNLLQVRTQTLVKNAIVQIDATPFKQWYSQHYGLEVGLKKKLGAANVPGTEAQVGQGCTAVQLAIVRDLGSGVLHALPVPNQAGQA